MKLRKKGSGPSHDSLRWARLQGKPLVDTCLTGAALIRDRDGQQDMSGIPIGLAIDRIISCNDPIEKERLARNSARALKAIIEDSCDDERLKGLIAERLDDCHELGSAFRELGMGFGETGCAACPAMGPANGAQTDRREARARPEETAPDMERRAPSKKDRSIPFFGLVALCHVLAAGWFVYRDSTRLMKSAPKPDPSPKPGLVIKPPMHPSQEIMAAKDPRTGEPEGPENPAVLRAARDAVGKDTGPFSLSQVFNIHDFMTRKLTYQNVSNGAEPRIPRKTLEDAKAGDCKSMAVLESAMLESKGAETVFIDWAEPEKRDGGRPDGHELLGVMVWHSASAEGKVPALERIRRGIRKRYRRDMRRMRMIYPRRDIGPHFIELELHGRKEAYLLLDATFGRHSLPGMANLGEEGVNLDHKPGYDTVSARITHKGKVLTIYDARPGELGSVP